MDFSIIGEISQYKEHFNNFLFSNFCLLYIKIINK
ncbi:MAG: hypothetical protein QG635_311 [Bacteroidota bacterium]|nr:hypothetical protein [Bacteroidota bacterium]